MTGPADNGAEQVRRPGPVEIRLIGHPDDVDRITDAIHLGEPVRLDLTKRRGQDEAGRRVRASRPSAVKVRQYGHAQQA